MSWLISEKTATKIRSPSLLGNMLCTQNYGLSSSGDTSLDRTLLLSTAVEEIVPCDFIQFHDDTIDLNPISSEVVQLTGVLSENDKLQVIGYSTVLQNDPLEKAPACEFRISQYSQISQNIQIKLTFSRTR